ncbi:ComF family protein [bacterium]|nr:MAG: ComF family protein [bacterium]
MGYTHADCKTDHTPDRLISIFKYQDKLVSKMLNTGKIGLISDLFFELASIGFEKVDVRYQSLDKFVLCPIPLTRFKKRFRGFNQSYIIAQIFSWRFNLAIDPVLIKSKSTRQQKQLNRQQRQENLTESFSISDPSYLPRQVLLIDDITTTGSTFIEAARELKANGVKTVWCLALAQD